MKNKALVLIKPEGFKYRELILNKLFPLGRIVYDCYYGTTPLDTLKEHYREHLGTELYSLLLKYYKDKPLEVIIFEGEEVVTNIKSIVGFSDPKRSAPGTIRRLSNDSLEKATIEKRPIKNLVHCSANLMSAKREISIWTNKEGGVK